jgi:hypothetical protein
MHNIDRTNYETYGEYPGEYTGESEADEQGYEFEGDQEFETYGESYQEGVFSEAEEMGLASELLGVSNEAELEQFLGKLLKKASQAVGGFLKSDTGHKLLGAAKNIAKQALPTLGGMAGSGTTWKTSGCLTTRPSGTTRESATCWNYLKARCQV